MEKLTPTPVYLITSPSPDFQRTDEFIIQDKTGNVINYLEKQSLFVHSETQLREILEEAFDAGREYEGTWGGPDKEEYINNLLK